ncbi:putative bifunctional diguanylate cyclase/phosphodiesterase [Rugamonas apoptosis]|uniref:EAL domain-containing protein n=1 Tax=Rugamonas apoptosis TaxID=2758570 RepID=A0A7W2IN93_9BURK|nr:EAL domain-containing protein [Rugamonas apoptosis]MBA5690391.1 EAL domain-containing protein [Rugamonas apoptosis]
MAAPTALAHWRAQIFARLLLVVFVLGVVTAIPSALLAAREGIWLIAAIDVLAIGWTGAIWRLRRVTYATRVWHFLSVIYVVGVGLLLKVGPISQIYLLAIPVLAALLLGFRPAMCMLALTTATVLALGYQADAGLQVMGLPAYGMLRSLIIALNFLFIAAVLTLSCAVLLRHLAHSLEELAASAASLEQSRNHLVAVNDDIHRLAFYDVLTGLPNRRLLIDRIDTLLAANARDRHYSAVLFIDLDRFKFINDARGHGTGDALLRAVAERLLPLMRKADTVARIGGDEFVVVLSHLAPALEAATLAARTVADKIRHAIATPFVIDGQRYACSASIGVTLLPQSGQNAQDLLREADTAMYRAKADGRNGIAFYEPAMQADVERRLDMERDLAAALAAARLEMHAQPQVDHHGRTVGAEMLMRWPLPGGGAVPPSVFIPVAEESGLILQLGQWALQQTCLAARGLARAGHPLTLSVNVSPSQFRQAGFVEQVRATLAATGAPASMLVLEVTEGLLVEKMDATIERMHALAALGLRFSIDDFGTGYSSLAYLRLMPLYELKIDRSFVTDAPHDSGSGALVQTILSMARHLGLRVVAEGVETADQAAFLIGHHCHCMQGYLYGRAMPVEALLARLTAEAEAQAQVGTATAAAASASAPQAPASAAT